jgi:hypothetical protein
MCTISPYYTFSDINNGPPTQNCTTAFVNYWNEYWPIFTGVFAGLTVSMFLGLMATCVVCCCNKKKEDNPYEQLGGNGRRQSSIQEWTKINEVF